MKDRLNTAKNILQKNRCNNYTVPSNNLYKHQWSWDSGWISFGLSLIDEIDYAEKELINLFNNQWKNGLVPSIVFNLDNIDYFPGPIIWELEKYASNNSITNNTTGIIQPPIHSYASLNLFNKSNNINFLEAIYPKLIKWHEYLYNERDPFNEGLIYIRHPWESGMDNSPIWDVALGRINISEYKYSHMRVDNKKVNSDERPTNLTYEKYLKLIEIFKENNYNENKIFKNTEFAIQDVLFNVLLLKSNFALKNISNILKKDTSKIDFWINLTQTNIHKKFYKDDFYYDYDLIGKKSINIKTVTGLSPIIIINEKSNLVNVMKCNFLDIKNNNYNISSIDRFNPQFDEINYWRGPTWVNITWLILSGLKSHDYDLYSKIKNNITSKIEDVGFYEYFNSNDIVNKPNSGIGDNFFSWTASIYICLISNSEF